MLMVCPSIGRGIYSNGKAIYADPSLKVCFFRYIAKPGQAATQMPQPLHLSKSTIGRFVISSPTTIACCGQAVSHGLQGNSLDAFDYGRKRSSVLSRKLIAGTGMQLSEIRSTGNLQSHIVFFHIFHFDQPLVCAIIAAFASRRFCPNKPDRRASIRCSAAANPDRYTSSETYPSE